MNVGKVLSLDQVICQQAQNKKDSVATPKVLGTCACSDTFFHSESKEDALDLVAKDFCHTESEKLPDKVLDVVKWGAGSLSAYAAASLVKKHEGRQDDPELFIAVRKLLDPR